MLNAVHRLHPQLATDSALDFGCGIGRLTEPLREHFRSVVGLDMSEEMIRQASGRLKGHDGIRFVVNTTADLAVFSDASFDFVNEFVVFQHMRPERTYPQLSARVLESASARGRCCANNALTSEVHTEGCRACNTAPATNSTTETAALPRSDGHELHPAR